jgi:hypothetical protein
LTREEREIVVLDIDENDLLSPLLVIQTLSNNETTSLDLLKVNLVVRIDCLMIDLN